MDFHLDLCHIAKQGLLQILKIYFNNGQDNWF